MNFDKENELAIKFQKKLDDYAQFVNAENFGFKDTKTENSFKTRLINLNHDLQNMRESALADGIEFDRTYSIEKNFKDATKEEISKFIKMGQGSWETLGNGENEYGSPNTVTMSVLDFKEFQSLKNDREFVLDLVKNDGYCLMMASDALKNDSEIVAEALKQDGYHLQFASSELQNNKEVVLEALKNNTGPLRTGPVQFASDDIQKLCSGKDPVKALQASILADELQAEMKPKPEQKQKLKMKI